MKKTLLTAALSALLLSACNNSISDTQINQDVHRVVSKAEQCYANVHNDLLDSLDLEYFSDCNEELQDMLTDTYKKYEKEEDRRKFDSLFMVEIQKKDIDNDFISVMLEIYRMNFDE